MSIDSGQDGRGAVVIGSSLAGLLAARVLSTHFPRVTLIERDEVRHQAEVRKGQPQARHVHGLLTSGLNVMTRYFPGLPERLRAGGARLVDFAKGLRWHAAGGYRLQFETGLLAAFVSRPFLEWQIRQEVLSRPNVTLLDHRHVTALLTTDDRDRVVGVSIRGSAGGSDAELRADLVVDATGRGSLTPKWLETLGYRRPEEHIVPIDVRYTSRIYRRRPGDLQGAEAVLISPAPPENNRLGALFPMEDDRWIVSLAGWGGEHAPADEAGFLRFAQQLPAPDIARLLPRLEPLSEIFTQAFPANRRRHFERLSAFPEGLLVIGDGVCSFNPAYGQGMTAAAMQAAVLDDVLSAGPSHRRLWQTYFRRVAKVVDTPWQMALCEDFRFPKTRGRRPIGSIPMNAYLARVQRATHHDPLVYGAFIEVLNLIAPPGRLFLPTILWRLFRNWWRGGADSERGRRPAGHLQTTCPANRATQ
ncbi:MAG: FAD-dependent oxidoreductase [Planctomycetes bacterium]|nr:FAD-dependent oxidoreductase [Planctomycetota bacterium]